MSLIKQAWRLVWDRGQATWRVPYCRSTKFRIAGRRHKWFEHRAESFRAAIEAFRWTTAAVIAPMYRNFLMMWKYTVPCLAVAPSSLSGLSASSRNSASVWDSICSCERRIPTLFSWTVLHHINESDLPANPLHRPLRPNDIRISPYFWIFYCTSSHQLLLQVKKPVTLQYFWTIKVCGPEMNVSIERSEWVAYLVSETRAFRSPLDRNQSARVSKRYCCHLLHVRAGSRCHIWNQALERKQSRHPSYLSTASTLLLKTAVNKTSLGWNSAVASNEDLFSVSMRL